jgi:hypothetical protein
MVALKRSEYRKREAALRGLSYYSPYIEIIADGDSRCDVLFCDEVALPDINDPTDNISIVRILEITPDMITMWPIRVSLGKSLSAC